MRHVTLNANMNARKKEKNMKRMYTLGSASKYPNVNANVNVNVNVNAIVAKWITQLCIYMIVLTRTRFFPTIVHRECQSGMLLSSIDWIQLCVYISLSGLQQLGKKTHTQNTHLISPLICCSLAIMSECHVHFIVCMNIIDITRFVVMNIKQ